jgi:hypothetical protein
MAENPLIDLAQTVMIEKYGLCEQSYALVSFSEGAKTISVKMSDGEIPVQAWFPRDFLRLEEMKRWTYEKKEKYVIGLVSEGMDLRPELQEDFEFDQLFTKIAMGNKPVGADTKTFDLEAGDRVVLSMKDGELTVTEGQDKLVEESAEEFESKVEGKKRKKKLVKTK